MARQFRPFSTGLTVLAVLAATGCARRSPSELRSVWRGQPPTVEPPAAHAAADPLLPVGASRAGGAVVLAQLGARKLAFVADEDAGAVRVLDATTYAPSGEIALGTRPSQLVVGGDGRLYVALRDENRVVALEWTGGETTPMVQVSEIDVAAEPVALAATPDGGTLLVTSGWGAALTAFAVPGLRKRFQVPLGREPRGVVVGDDGSAYVVHALGSRVSRVTLPAGQGEGAPDVAVVALGGTELTRILRKPICILPMAFHEGDDDGPLGGSVVPAQFVRDIDGDEFAHFSRATSQGFAVTVLEGQIFAPEVAVVRGEVSVGGYGTSDSFPANQPVVVAIDRGGAARLRFENVSIAATKSRTGFEGGQRPDGCLLPRAAASDEARGLVLVSCLGTNEVLAYDGSREPLANSLRGRWKVPAGPVGIAVDSAAGVALVWSQFDRALSALSLPPAKAPAGEGDRRPRATKRMDAADPARVAALPRLAAREGALDDAAERGRRLFHGAGDPRISSDGRACASCHPDGRDDGLTWPTPSGARQTPMLAGRLDRSTAPFGWQGDAQTVAAHLEQTFVRLGGRGLKGADLDALLAYLDEMSKPRSSADEPPDQVARGKELFFSEAVGCSTCHVGATGSDGARHDVGGGARLETPSLRFVAGTAPYFHDGKYESLSDLLRKTKGKMGWAADMSDADLSAVEAYLRTL